MSHKLQKVVHVGLIYMTLQLCMRFTPILCAIQVLKCKIVDALMIYSCVRALHKACSFLTACLNTWPPKKNAS